MTDHAELVRYDITETQIAEKRAAFAVLDATTPKGYESVRLAIAECRNTRVLIEKRRVELKADALAFGRLVDAEAKRWTALLTEIEDPLQVKKDAIDAERERVRFAAEETKRLALEAEIRAKREAEEAAAKAIREAEAAALAEERARLDAERLALAEERRRTEEAARVVREADEQHIAEERAKLEADRMLAAQEVARLQEQQRDRELAALAERRKAEAKVAETQRLEREAIEAERRKVAAEREAANRAEFERTARINAEREAVANAERDRLETAKRAARLAELAPDLDKVRVFVAAIRALTAPKVRSKAVRMALESAARDLANTANGLESVFAPETAERVAS